MSTPTPEAAILSTIRHITAKKLDKAASRLNSLASHLHDAEAALKYAPETPDAHSLDADVSMLLSTVRKAFAGSLDIEIDRRCEKEERTARPITLNSRLDTIERMLWEAKYSSGFSKSAVLAWRQELLDLLRQGHRRMSYTRLFGDLTNEWATVRFGELSERSQEEESSGKEDESQVTIGRKEMYQQRQIWESHVTDERHTDTDKITSFLDTLFHAGPQQKEQSAGEPIDLRETLLHKIRKSIIHDCKMGPFVSEDTVKGAIQGVLSADQLTSQKRRALLDISNKDNVILEISRLLSIEISLDSLSRWSWGENPVTVQMRKAINGKYRVFLDMELLDAVLIQLIGQFVSINITEALSLAWLWGAEEVWQPKSNEAREAAMENQIPDIEERNSDKTSVHNLRQEMYRRFFYNVGLPKTMDDVQGSYEDTDSNDDNDNDGLSPRLTDLIGGKPNKMTLRTDILRVCSAEMVVQKLTHGQFCVLQSDFEWFGPSLPHSTLIAIMKYFYFPSDLVQFVQSFLSMSMRFQEDGSDGPVVTRRAGIPLSFQITDGISELLLFVLDFAVNQRTDGSFLYRNHDDLWFWGQPEKCATAWETICEFTEVMGLRLNKDKTGCAHAVDESSPRYLPVDQSVMKRLPEGKVKWGFLVFDEKEWKWTANKPAIKEHMSELRYQLKGRTAVMGHVQAYNAYIQNFLPNNFGQVVVGLGDSHAIMVLEALRYALQCLYSQDDSDSKKGSEKQAVNAAEHVRHMIQEHFDDQYDVPDCFLYMNVDSGGLGLANPVPEFAQYVNILQNKDLEGEEEKAHELPPLASAVREAMDCFSSLYRADKKKFLERRRGKKKSKKHGRDNSDTDYEISSCEDELGKRLQSTTEFMSFSDYIATSEGHSRALRGLYATLLRAPPVQGDCRRKTKDWAAEVFSDELVGLFGGRMAEDEFLTLGLYRTLVEEKVRWEG